MSIVFITANKVGTFISEEITDDSGKHYRVSVWINNRGPIIQFGRAETPDDAARLIFQAMDTVFIKGGKTNNFMVQKITADDGKHYHVYVAPGYGVAWLPFGRAKTLDDAKILIDRAIASAEPEDKVADSLLAQYRAATDRVARVAVPFIVGGMSMVLASLFTELTLPMFAAVMATAAAPAVWHVFMGFCTKK